MKREILKTKDGSETLYVPELDEHYHSYNGACQESMHVFINAGLKALKSKEVKVFEMGLGTGLNCLLTLLHAENRTVEYTSLEKYPVDIPMAMQLNYTEVLELGDEDKKIYQAIHDASWDIKQELSTKFILRKYQADIKTYKHITKYNLIYYDAFAPDVQSDLWTKDIFQDLYNALDKGGILTTYCAKGVVRRTLQDCGFTVERLPGPPGKREMIRASKGDEV